MLRILCQRVGAAPPRVPVSLFLLFVVLALATATSAQTTLKTYLFNMRPSADYFVHKNGSSLTSTYSSPAGIVAFAGVSSTGGFFSVSEDSAADTSPPSPPLIQSADENTPACVLVQWLATSDPEVVAFEVGIGRRSVAGGDAPSYDQVVNVGNVTDHEFCDLALGDHYVAVRARNRLWLPSAFSTELVVTVSSTAVTITTFEATAAGSAGESVALAWDIFSDERLLGFELYRSRMDDPGRGSPVHGLQALPPTARSLLDASVTPATWYRYTLVVIGEDGAEAAWFSRTVKTGAARLELEQNVPNPFNPHTNISFVLPAAARIRLDIFDVEGRLVSTLVDGTMPAGRHRKQWGGRDRRGNPVATGTYFYRLTAGKRSLCRKMLLLK
jgi:hypothetical protein